MSKTYMSRASSKLKFAKQLLDNNSDDSEAVCDAMEMLQVALVAILNGYDATKNSSNAFEKLTLAESSLTHYEIEILERLLYQGSSILASEHYAKNCFKATEKLYAVVIREIGDSCSSISSVVDIHRDKYLVRARNILDISNHLLYISSDKNPETYNVAMLTVCNAIRMVMIHCLSQCYELDITIPWKNIETILDTCKEHGIAKFDKYTSYILKLSRYEEQLNCSCEVNLEREELLQLTNIVDFLLVTVKGDGLPHKHNSYKVEVTDIFPRVNDI